MLKRILFIIILFLLPYTAQAQTPLVLRVKVDATGALVAIGSSQTLPLTSCLFMNCRLAVDASGNLKVVVVGGTIVSPILAPTQTDCTVVSYSFTGRTTTGLNSHAANTWNLCGGGTLSLSGNTTDVTSSLQLTVPKLLFSTNLGAINPASNGVFTLLDTAGTSFGRVQLGGTTASFPAIKRNSAGIDFRLADDSAYANVNSNAYISEDGTAANPSFTFRNNNNLGFFNSSNTLVFSFGGSARANFGAAFSYAGEIASTSSFNLRSSLGATGIPFIINTAPSAISACGGGTAPTFAFTNGTAAFEIITGSATPVATCTWTMPSATTKWVCTAVDITTQSTSVFLMKQTASSQTSVTVTNYNTAGTATAVVASDHLLVKCSGG